MKDRTLTQSYSLESAGNPLVALLQFEASNRLNIACIIAFLLPIKLSLVYIVLSPALIAFLTSHYLKLEKLSLPRSMIPFVLFVLIAFLTAGFGIDPIHSILQLVQLAFFGLTLWYFLSTTSQTGQLFKIATALLSGQALAALHSVIDSSFNAELPRFFLGAVTESGQLAITVPLALGLLLQLQSELPKAEEVLKKSYLKALVSCVALLAVAFASKVGMPVSLQVTACFVVTLYALFVAAKLIPQVLSSSSANIEILCRYLIELIIPLTSIALITNMKRGPWLAGFIACSIILFFFRKRLLIPLILSIIALFLFVDPLQTRLLQSLHHFFITGGRWTIWQIGFELLTQYPLGIGFENSSFLQNFSSELPVNLVHFHSNLLNICAETGWIGLFLFIWWLARLLRESATPTRLPFLTRACGCSVISWQLAGIVEYNFGDSEVLLVAFVVIAFLVTLIESRETNSVAPT